METGGFFMGSFMEVGRFFMAVSYTSLIVRSIQLCGGMKMKRYLFLVTDWQSSA